MLIQRASKSSLGHARKGINLLINLQHTTPSFAPWLSNCHLEGLAHERHYHGSAGIFLVGREHKMPGLKKKKKKKSQNSDYLISPFFSANPNFACCRRLTNRETLQGLCWITRMAKSPWGPASTCWYWGLSWPEANRDPRSAHKLPTERQQKSKAGCIQLRGTHQDSRSTCTSQKLGALTRTSCPSFQPVEWTSSRWPHLCSHQGFPGGSVIIPMADSCWSLTENNNFCKAINLSIKK